MIQPKIKIDKKKKEAQREKMAAIFIYLVFAFAVIVLLFATKSILFPAETNNQLKMPAAMNRMSLTLYDKELARKMMDKNNDGKCDACGMPVEMCMDSGQLQCDMDSKSTIGVLESQHIHADWKVYINGEALDFTGKDHMTRMGSGSSVSSFIHVDSGAPASEKIGDVLHMHATGVPLWIFFESIGMKFEKDCLILETGEKYCNDDTNTLKFYVDGQKNNQYENYIFKDLDKILISYGSETQEEVQSQINSITDFAKIH